MTSYRTMSIAFALILALGAAGPTTAQGIQLAQATSPGKGPQGMGPGMMGGQGMGPGMMGGQGMGPEMMGRHVEGRIAFLHTELKITPAQAKLWDSYADALRASATDMTSMWARMTTMMTATALPERLEAAETMMSERLDELKKVKTAALPLYAAFSAEQKATADELMPAMGMGMGMGMGWGMGWRGTGQ